MVNQERTYAQSERADRPHKTPGGPIHDPRMAPTVPQFGSKNGGKAPSVPHLMKYDICLFGLVEPTAQAYRENGPRPISVQRRAVAASIWNNPPAASDGWRNPRRAAVARLRGPMGKKKRKKRERESFNNNVPKRSIIRVSDSPTPKIVF